MLIGMTGDPDLEKQTDAFAALERRRRVDAIVHHPEQTDERNVADAAFELVRLHRDQAKAVAAERLVRAAELSDHLTSKFWARVYTAIEDIERAQETGARH